MRQVQKKIKPEEETPSPLEVVIRGMDGGELKVLFNKSRKHFAYDVIQMEIFGKKIDIVRDELASAIIRGYKISTPDKTETDIGKIMRSNL